MRVSEYYELGRRQPSLDFVDVDIQNDTKLFLDPRALRLLQSEWADECTALIQNFFRTVLQRIRRGANRQARSLLAVLKEPNETHLGLSKGRSKGRAVGTESAQDVWSALSRSQAAQSGLLEDLEDTILMVPGISSDIISDIATNIIREPLIRYTKEVAEYYGIQLEDAVDSGPLWDPKHRNWYSQLVPLPVTPHGKLLLVPKVIVRRRLEYDAEEYFQHYILEHLREVELSANSELVHLLRNGRPRVTKKDLIAKYGRGKAVSLRVTLSRPQILQSYRRDKQTTTQPPLDHEALAASEVNDPPDWEALMEAVRRIRPGRQEANSYEAAIESLLSAVFYPSLTNPQVQTRIHDGRKIIDITYTNCASTGFFLWLLQNYSAPHVFVECKNYRGDPANPELDQLSGRFSPSRGQFGLLVCRNIRDKPLFRQRCRDTANDQRGFITALDDDDLSQLVAARTEAADSMSFDGLMALFDQLVL